MATYMNMDLINNIDSATARYFKAYEHQFTGRTEDYVHLRDLTVCKLRDVRTVAPKFYHTQLHTLVNQAATRLNLNRNNVNANHRIFLMILDSLITSQPTGDVDFETEKKHIEALDKLHKQQKELRAQEQNLAAAELDYDDLDDDSSSGYVLHENIQRKLLKVSKTIARLQNLRSEETPFNLVPKPGLGLDMLSKRQQDLFERIDQGIKRILTTRTKGKTRLELPDRGLIKDMLDEVLSFRVDPDDAKEILEEVYGALRNYFRDIDLKKTEEQHQYYLKANYLLPREGEIITDPNNVPPEVLYQLKKSHTAGEEKMNQVLDSFARKKRALEENQEPNKMLALENGPVRVSQAADRVDLDDGDDCDVDDDDEEDEEDEESEDDGDDSDIEVLDIGYTNEEIRSLVRVKEEPIEKPPITQPNNGPIDQQMNPDPVMEVETPGDPFAEFAELDNLIKEQEELTYNIDFQNSENREEEEENDDDEGVEEDDEVDEEDEDGEDEECKVIQCLGREDKIQTVDLIDDDC